MVAREGGALAKAGCKVVLSSRTRCVCVCVCVVSFCKKAHSIAGTVRITHALRHREGEMCGGGDGVGAGEVGHQK